MSVNLAKHCFTVSEYERMGETGVFAPDARLELIEGEIIEMSPIGSHHAACVELITQHLHRIELQKFLVRSQNPIVLDDFSEPEPDVCIVKFREDNYRRAHPRAVDVALVIEVADSTVPFDRHVKLPLYARAGIPEFLLFNLNEEQVEHFSRPEGGLYRDNKLLKRGDRFESGIVAGLSLDIAAILG